MFWRAVFSTIAIVFAGPPQGKPPQPPKRSAALCMVDEFMGSFPIAPLLAEDTQFPPGRCLVQADYGYEIGTEFEREMGKQILKTTELLRLRQKKRRKVTPVEVETWLDHLANTRFQVSGQKPENRTYGLKTPRTNDQMRIYLHHLYENVPEPFPLEEWVKFPIDNISKDPHHSAYRHHNYYDPASSLIGKGRYSPPRIIRLGKAVVTLSSLMRRPDGTIVVIHPSYAEGISFQTVAFRVLADLASSRSMPLDQFIDRAAGAYFLFAQSPPYLHGSPSIVESFIDSLLRAKYGLTLGQKIDEPFWSAIFSGISEAPFTGREFLRHYSVKNSHSPEDLGNLRGN